ncbi:DNA helicase RecQ [Aquimarina sp. ERC-38]|uniref:DNA helicase RecQ n=1 Tax=Aquimarina sp. ERC-38 TaxID=2949996 RepID=UPI00224804F7|nr:DNA helicase RecQ [Aquimarina sp. ERC-38]UZO80219.1 DNA helicase RecQ [Aquimarina sp. ERC-38]
MITEKEKLSTLKEYFGYDQFRPLQSEIIQGIFDKKDQMVVMPTGGGKSLCYQLPALLLPGTTLVISPLIALMKDQVDGLKANGVEAAYLNSSQSQTEHQSIFNELLAKNTKLLYIAPESLSVIDTVISQLEISMIAIDEAHCISAWGHDFRPAYTQLGYLKNKFPEVPIVALTATADKATRTDICQQLNIPHAELFLASFNRKNLFLEVRPGIKRVEQILNFINSKPEESGIIYCLSRKNTEMLRDKLKAKGFLAEAYHAGLPHDRREKVQEDFINDRIAIVCATIAFGMGIDKSNVRWVIHYNLPKNMEGYYQEIGRAGRDGLPSATLLFHSYADVVQLQRFADMSGNQEVQLAKLERMKQYAESLSCRRKILLSYFGEHIEKDCGHCDVCKNPPEFIDGTIVAQKALSCIIRLGEEEPIGTLIDVLRGAQNATVLDNNYQQLKTYGIGRDLSWQDWQQYIIQLINQGFVEIAFHLNNKLKITPRAKKVLFEGEKVRLANLKAIEKQKETLKKAAKTIQEDTLFQRLRKLRLSIAQKNDIPAYQIFSDATLKDIEKSRPLTDDEFLQVNGVGRAKMQKYGHQFIKEILAFSSEKRTKTKKRLASGDSYKLTLDLLNQGKTPEEISTERGLALSTIYGHLFKLSEAGHKLDLTAFIDASSLKAIEKAREELKNPDKLKVYFDYFEETMDYNTIRMALIVLDQKETN